MADTSITTKTVESVHKHSQLNSVADPNSTRPQSTNSFFQANASFGNGKLSAHLRNGEALTDIGTTPLLSGPFTENSPKDIENHSIETGSENEKTFKKVCFKISPDWLENYDSSRVLSWSAIEISLEDTLTLSVENQCIRKLPTASSETNISNRFSTISQSSVYSSSSSTHDIDAHFAARQLKTLGSFDSMADVVQLTEKLQLTTKKQKKRIETEILKRISQNETALTEHSPRIVEFILGDDDDDHVKAEPVSDVDRKQQLQKSLVWVRRALLDMRNQDQEIARKLISISLEIQRHRLLQTVEIHKNTLEDIAINADEEKEYSASNLCEPPEHLKFAAQPPSYFRDLGLTKRNISNRRFSIG